MTTTMPAARTAPRDPYARIADLDDATVAALAERFEIRTADPRQHHLWRDFLARAPHLLDSRVLEVGCGTGIITTMIAELPGVVHAVGVDPCPGFIDRARRRAPALRFEVADGRRLPFDDATFDGVVFATTLCRVPAPERALAEARRVLRPGGYLLVYDGDYATTTVAVGDHDPLQAALLRPSPGSYTTRGWCAACPGSWPTPGSSAASCAATDTLRWTRPRTYPA